MPIELPKTEVQNTQGFPANENSTFPNKSTVNVIIGSTVIIFVAAVVFSFVMKSSGQRLEVPMPTGQQQSQPVSPSSR
ncbi:MAG: hypothetical protein JSS86_07965 [Cyanobacteria bacterium SZAS LIN-2]|nr:hypothetical protein [Cyanobacteria bacterium SZAS LIN-3]MBS1996229.1 hypothetical protein [Cyanobacteria bacterium SZAS LIN-2]MBS2007593.1 hypothetical protein [Cyanobacteria bacterium SZAS TMP-1]